MMFDKTKFRQKILALTSGVLFCLVIIGTALASHGPRTQYTGWVGRTVIAQKDVVYAGSSSWNGQIFSHTQDGYAIGSIGWTYWTIREYCGTTFKNQYVYGGVAINNSSGIYDYAVDVYNSCSTTRYGHVLGNHEFKNVGYTTWYKDWTHVENMNQ